MKKEFVSEYFRNKPEYDQVTIEAFASNAGEELGIDVGSSVEARSLCAQIGVTRVRACQILRIIEFPEISLGGQGILKGFGGEGSKYLAVTTFEGNIPVIYYSNEYINALLKPSIERDIIEVQLSETSPVVITAHECYHIEQKLRFPTRLNTDAINSENDSNRWHNSRSDRAARAFSHTYDVARTYHDQQVRQRLNVAFPGMFTDETLRNPLSSVADLVLE